MSFINNEPQSASDSDLLLASGGGLSSEAFGRALRAFGKVAGEAVGPALDGFLVYQDIEETSAYRDQAAQSKAAQKLIQSDTSSIKARTAELYNQSNRYDSLDAMILDAKAQLGDSWPDFVKFVNSEQWKDG